MHPTKNRILLDGPFAKKLLDNARVYSPGKEHAQFHGFLPHTHPMDL